MLSRIKNTWRIDSAEKLTEVVRGIDIAVPLRSEGRLNDHTERYCMARLLFNLQSCRLRFPLQLQHTDRPDFVLSMADSIIGIEHSEAVPQNYAKAGALREQGHGPDMYFAVRAAPGEPEKARAQIIKEIEANAPGDGWHGDSVEREWADAMLFFIKKKIEKTQRNGFARHPHNWLLLYDNWPGPSCDLEKAIAILQPRLVADSADSIFDAIFIINERAICEIADRIDIRPIKRISA